MEKKLTPFMISEGIWMVPCYNNREGNMYQPVATPNESISETITMSFRQTWTLEEDKALEELTESLGPKAWAKVANEINKTYHDGKPFRKGKQCRERYFNHINPMLRKGNWSVEEDEFIVMMQCSNGNRWSEIAKKLPGRNENQVKNRWKSLKQKMKNNPRSEIKIQPVSVSISPATTFIPYKIDPGFSCLADLIRSQYYAQANEATPPFHLYFPN